MLIIYAANEQHSKLKRMLKTVFGPIIHSTHKAEEDQLQVNFNDEARQADVGSWASSLDFVSGVSMRNN